ncbi:MAG: response regulator transcription factor [Eggerthellaceae bacterium]|jgi:two-component system KDP operon response regulator KdpE
MAHDEILIVEDDRTISQLLQVALESKGYRAKIADTARKGMALFRSDNPALVLLDLGLPDGDGMHLLAQMRLVGKKPIIVVSARDQEAQKIAALDAGADDYVTKPFSTSELLARIRVALRHQADAGSAASAEKLTAGGLVCDIDSRTVTTDGAPVHLTPIEFKLLVVLMRNPGKVLTHRFIQEEVWGYPTSDGYQTLRVFMASLRRKLGERASEPRYVTTEIGVGYRFIAE